MSPNPLLSHTFPQGRDSDTYLYTYHKPLINAVVMFSIQNECMTE